HGLTKAARQAAARGNIVLVGRGTGQLIADAPNVLHVRLVAPREWRARRMAQREGWTFEHALARCTEEDRNRHRFLRYFFGDIPFQPARYALVINTGRVPLDNGVAAVLALIRADWTSGADLKSALATPGASNLPHHRVLTLARELGAGD